MSQFSNITPADQQEAATDDIAVVFDSTTGLSWTKDDASERSVNADEANAIAAEFNEKKAAGFDDWRVPTVEELFLLGDRTRARPAIDTEFFPSTKNDWYRTSTPDCEAPAADAWFVDFHFGHAGIFGVRGLRARLRLVRGPARQ